MALCGSAAFCSQLPMGVLWAAPPPLPPKSSHPRLPQH